MTKMTHDENDPPSLEPHGPQEPRDPLAQPEPAEPSTRAAFEPIESEPPSGITLPWIAPALPDDLRVPWGWRDLLLLVGVGSHRNGRDSTYPCCGLGAARHPAFAPSE